MINIDQTIISQYSHSPILRGLLSDWNQAIDPRADQDLFYAKAWDVSTAEGWGLDLWGRIVGVSRFLTLPPADVPAFGFYEAGSWAPFDEQPFWDGSLSGSTYRLDDVPFRTLILVKALANITTCSALDINRVLRLLFGNMSKCYVVDVGDMTMRLVFETPLDVVDLSVLTQSGAVLRPAGVQAFIMNGYDPSATFGFDGSDLQPLNQGMFFSGYHIINL